MELKEMKLENKIIFIIIKDNANDSNLSTISISEIIQECGRLFDITRKRVSLIIKDLVNNNLLSIVEKGTGRSTKTTYLINK